MSTRAVFLDALGTLVALEPPAPRLAELLGISLDERLERAVRAEMAYYRDHSHEGRDAASLAALRGRCAVVLSAELGIEVDAETLMKAIRFRGFDDVAPALGDLRSRGVRIVCVSNWDCSLPDVLAKIGIAALLDGVVTSATAGASKPDPAIFEPALSLAGCAAAEAIHVGDTATEDVAGALAAGVGALLLTREGEPEGPIDGAGAISSLIEISDHLER